MSLPQRPLEEPYRSRAVPPGTARYWSWLFSARESRDSLLGVYALLAEWRALMDPGTESGVAHLKIAWWREEMDRLAAGSPLHPIGRYLAELPRTRVADLAPLSETVEAAARQIAGAPLERGADLEAHSGALHARPLIVAARLASDRSIERQAGTLDSVAALGAAQYLADAIADYRREARCGRVVFPVEELLAAGIEDADLTAADPPPRLQSYLDELRRRAAQLFAAAADALPRADRPQLRHVLVLAALGAKDLRGRADSRELNHRLRALYLAWRTARRAARGEQ